MAMISAGKKGIFFTFIAVTIMAALIIILTPGASVNIAPDKPVVETRVAKVNDFVLDLENSYFESILRVSSHKAVLALISYVNDNGLFTDLSELELKFSEAVLDGKINGENQPIMEDNTLKNWTNRMVNVSENTFNVDSEFTINSVNLSQLRPWFVELRLNISFSVSSETSSWDVDDYIVNAELSIEGFNDPYYLVNTGGSYFNRINKTNTTFDKWNLEKTKDHIRYGTYRYNGEAPNFLMRFTNSISSSDCCGIESLVNPNNPAIPPKDVSYADYQFWSTTPDCNNLDLYQADAITTEFPDFKLDLDHTVSYDILSDSQKICPPPT